MQHEAHIVVIGGGITGLSAAWALERAVRQGVHLRYTVLEAGERWGGKLWTERVETPEGTFVIEAGADAFLTRKPAAMQLIRELGLDDRVIPANPYEHTTYVLRKGRPVPLPQGLSLLVPTRLGPFLASPLFSLVGKLRILCELLVPPKRGVTDESLASFIRRRLGGEALERLGEPLLAGIYNMRSDEQSIHATFPQFPAMEQAYGSLLRASWTTMRDTPRQDNKAPFVSFRSGVAELAEALVSALSGDLRLRAGVSGVRHREPTGYCLTLESGEKIDADGMIITTSSKIAARLLANVAPAAVPPLANIRYNSIGSTALAFRQSEIPRPLDGYGLVIPPGEQREIDGITWVSSKWDERAPAGFTLLRVFFGGPHSSQMMALDEAARLSVIRRELRHLFAIQADPLFTRTVLWPDGYPQYDLGHLQRVSEIEHKLLPDIRVAGNAYRGIGVPDCIRQGQEAARALLDLHSPASVASTVS